MVLLVVYCYIWVQLCAWNSRVSFLGFQKQDSWCLDWAERVACSYFSLRYYASDGTILQTPLCSSATQYLGVVSEGSIKPWCVCKQNNLQGTHKYTCLQCSPLDFPAWRALPWKGPQSRNALVWGSQNSVSTRFTKPYWLTCRVLCLLLSAGIDTIPEYRQFG